MVRGGLMDCYLCDQEIGDFDNPIFVLPDNTTVVCRSCYHNEEDDYPDLKSAQFDPDMVSVEVSDEYFNDLEN
jgi:hypothetical protein